MNKKHLQLVSLALKARENAYAPYSKFKVGAALLTKSGIVYIGTNIENSSYSLTMCAERVAIYKAVSEGEKEFEAIAIASDSDDFTSPCGACRQVLFELAGNLTCIMVNNKGKHLSKRLVSLIPLAFTKDSLK